MPYERATFQVIAGDSWSQDFQWVDAADNPRTLSPYDLTCTFRKREDSSASILSLSEGSGITVSVDGLTVTVAVTPAQMLSLVTDAGGATGADCFIVFDLVASISTTFKRTLVPGMLQIFADADR